MMFVKKKDAKEKLLGQVEPRTAFHRVRWSEVEASADRLNKHLKKTSVVLVPEKDHNYVTLNLYSKGTTSVMLDTMVSGLPTEVAKGLIDAIIVLLRHEMY
jgi:hypothetical protein